MKTLLFIISLIAPAILSAQNYRVPPSIDPLDTLDEVDLHAMRDTALITRRNIAQNSRNVNASDYILNDRYIPTDHTFDNSWYDHIYVGGSYGLEQIKPQTSDFRFSTMSQVNLFIGKEIDKKNSMRLSAGGGWGYRNTTNEWLTRIQARFDYIYNLSTHFNGYNPARRMEISLLLGAGTNFSWMRNTTTKVAPEGHFGLQMKCFTGPLGTINVEPYIGISSDQIDVSEQRNWRRYDVFYGINVNYSVFLIDNLSKEARLQLLQSRLADDRLVNPQTLEKWRTPWFVEMSNGIIMTSSPYLDFNRTLGHQTALSVGRWLSPVMGFRASAISRTTKWMEQEITAGDNGSTFKLAYNSNYVSGRMEALFNPFGFLKTFKWDNPMGAYLAFGGELGSLTKYTPDENIHIISESYDLGIHLWSRLSEDLQIFIEPRYSHSVYTQPANGGTKSMHRDNTWGVDMGLTMLIRSKRFSNPDAMDETQNYLYRDIRGFSAAIAGGMTLLQRKDAYYTGTSLNYNGMAILEYRGNHISTVSAHADFVTLHNASTPHDYNAKTSGVFASLNYQANLTNLCSGRFANRRFELEAFAGPAFGIGFSDNDKVLFGVNGGMKLNTYVWKGLSVFLMPSLYLMSSSAPISGNNTIGMGNMRLFETLNIGVQYKIGRLRRNAETLRMKRMQRDHEWELRQQAKDREAENRRKAAAIRQSRR